MGLTTLPTTWENGMGTRTIADTAIASYWLVEVATASTQPAYIISHLFLPQGWNGWLLIGLVLGQHSWFILFYHRPLRSCPCWQWATCASLTEGIPQGYRAAISSQATDRPARKGVAVVSLASRLHCSVHFNSESQWPSVKKSSRSSSSTS